MVGSTENPSLAGLKSDYLKSNDLPSPSPSSSSAMADESLYPEFSLSLISRSIVKAASHDPQPYVLPVSNFDRLAGRYPVMTVFYAYRKPPTGDLSTITTAINNSLSRILTHFPPFAGRILPNPESGESEILCNNQGAELIEALADVPLASLDFYDMDLSLKKVMFPFDHCFPLSVQVVGYTCGGFSIAWSFDHILADGAGFVKFLSLWAELAQSQTNTISSAPNHDRSIFRPRSPPNYSPRLDEIYTACSLDEIIKCSPISTIKRLYFVEGSCLKRMQARSSQGGSRRTRMEALSAYIWKTLASSLGGTHNKSCMMGWLVDGRRRVAAAGDSMNPVSMSQSDYVGNLVCMAVGEATMQELKEGSLSHVAGIASRAIGEVANAESFMELGDWIECRRPGMVQPKIFMGIGGPAVVVSSCHNMAVMSTDFGFGPPSVGTFYTTREGFGSGYVNMVSTGRGDGSWFVFAFVWPSLAAELESDPERVFQPITTSTAHLGM